MTQTMLSRWLKLVAIVVGAALAVFFALLMPWLTLVLRHSSYIGYTPPTAAHGIALLAAVDLTAIPCGGALLRFWRIADNIGRDRSFCRENVRHLLAISRYALVCVGWCLVVTAAFTVMGVIHLSFVAAALFLMLAGAAVAVAAAALAHLTEKAARIKEENDLTV